MTAALEGATSATVQLYTDQAGCFTAALDRVPRNSADSFSARK